MYLIDKGSQLKQTAKKKKKKRHVSKHADPVMAIASDARIELACTVTDT